MTTPGRPATGPGSAGCRSGGKQPGEWEDSPGMYHEVTRLRNELRAKDRELEEKVVEIRTLKSASLAQDKALDKAEAQLATVKDRLLGLEGDALSLRKSLARVEAERDSWRSEAEAASREADRANQATQSLVARDTGASLEVARLEAQVRELRAETQRLEADNKACYNVIRAKDKELARQSKQLAGGDEALLARKELENITADLRRQLSEAQTEVATLQRMQRLKDAEVSDAERDAQRTAKELQTTSEYLSAVTAELQVTKAKLKESKQEVVELRDALARAGAAAPSGSRADADGGKEGTISVLAHLEEVKYMQGEIHRLKHMLEHAEKAAQSSRQQKDRLYGRIDALTAAVGSPRIGLQLGGDDSAQESPGALAAAGEAVADDEGGPQAAGTGVALLAAQLETTQDRLEASEAEIEKLRRRLCELLGESTYIEEFGALPPALAEGEAEGAAAEGEPSVAQQAMGLVPSLQRQLEQAQGEAMAAREELQRHLEQGQQAAAVAAQEVATVEEDLRLQLEQAKQEAEAAQQEAAAQQDDLRLQLEQAQGEAEAAQLEVERVQAEADAALGEVQQLQQRLHVAEATADAASGEVDSLQEQLEAAEAARQAEVEQLQAEVAALQEQLAGLRAASGAAAGAAVGVSAAAMAGAGVPENGSSPSYPRGVAWELQAARRRVQELEGQLGEEPTVSGIKGEESSAFVGAASDDEADTAATANHTPAAAGGAAALSAAPAPAPVGMSPEALADLVERLVAQREAQRQEGAARDDGALFDEMTAGLKAELARLGREMVEKEAAAERLRSEVGSLEAAKLTAEMMASRLEEMNTLSMRVAALKLELSRAEAEGAAREAALQAELADLRARLAERKKSPARALKKTLSQAAKGFKDSLTGVGGADEAAAAATGSPPPKKTPRQLPFSLPKRQSATKASTPEDREPELLPS